MAEAEQPTGGEQSNETFRKEVTMVGYADEFDYMTLKDWANKVTGLNTNETYTETEEYWELDVNLGFKSHTETFDPRWYDEEDMERLVDAMQGVDDDLVTFEKKSDTKKLPKATLSSAADEVVRKLMQELPEELSGGLGKKEGLSRWKDENAEQVVRFWSEEFDNQRILAKEAERDGDDLYESVSKVPCFAVQIKMKAHSEDSIEEWNQEVISNAHKELSALPGVGKVRYMACTTRKEQQGECYNI